MKMADNRTLAIQDTWSAIQSAQHHLQTTNHSRRYVSTRQHFNERIRFYPALVPHRISAVFTETSTASFCVSASQWGHAAMR